MLKLCYREFELGTLSYDEENQEYIYNSNLEGEKNAKAKYLGMEFYSLSNSKDKRQKDIFTNFLIFIPALTRADIVKDAKIEQTDSTYEKLLKFAKLDMFDEDFHLKNN